MSQLWRLNSQDAFFSRVIMEMELDKYKYEEIITYNYVTWISTFIEVQAAYYILVWLFSFLAMSYNSDSYSYQLMRKMFGKKDKVSYPNSNKLDTILTEKQQLILSNRLDSENNMLLADRLQTITTTLFHPDLKIVIEVFVNQP